jgi:hypothetical protein
MFHAKTVPVPIDTQLTKGDIYVLNTLAADWLL